MCYYYYYCYYYFLRSIQRVVITMKNQSFKAYFSVRRDQNNLNIQT